MTGSSNAIAIIGMSGRFPDAADLDQFWVNLRDGVESLRPLTDEEMVAAGLPPAWFNQPGFVRAATILDDIDKLDAEFFGYAPREVEIMDPQQRMFLECAWEAMEDAGQVPGDDSATVGVYASVTMNTYGQSVVWRNPEVASAAGGYQVMLGNDKDFLTTRVSYKLNLTGPSLVVQTACSSSLVATQIAYQSLLKHQCDMALVGGSSITIPQHCGYMYQEGMIFSPDGHCRPFDANAAGTRAGHGVGVVLLKRLGDALADGDPIRAVILGAAINNDGAAKIGYTAPSVEGQAEVIAMAQALAQVEPDTIGYIEAHGTGTRIGDPIEIAALTRVFRSGTDKIQFCRIGSLKSNIGHLDAAAGIAGLIKTVLALEHKQIPPSINFTEPNPEIDFASSPFVVNDRLTDWTRTNGPRRAAVSSFGIGGTNAHVLLEEAPARAPSPDPGRDQIYLLSARNTGALDEAMANLGRHLSAEPDANMADVAFTTQVGRTAFRQRRFIVAGSREEVVEALSGPAGARVLGGTAGDSGKPVVFMFSGQGSQYPGMGAALYERFPTFRSALDESADILLPMLDLDLRDLILFVDGAADGSEAEEKLRETRLTQPALFAVEYAVARLWMSWGVEPDSMIGHSIGEYVAAHFAGVFSLEDALGLVSERGRLMQAQPGGTMFSVSLPEQEVRSLLDGNGSLAAVNAPALCTVAGSPEEMEELATRFEAQDVPFRRLHTSHAFHSEMMDPVLPDFRKRVEALELGAPQVPFVSNVTGTWITDDQATDPSYWVDHIRSGVRFSDGIRQVTADAEPILLEVGPGNTLATFARQCVGLGASGNVVSSLPHPKDQQPADRFLLEALGRLWSNGANVDWPALHDGEPRRRLALPTYPFQRKRYWIEPAAPTAVAPTATGKRPDIADWFYGATWTRSSVLEVNRPGYEDDPGSWLLLLNGDPVGERMAALLQGAGRTVTTATPGTEFAETGETAFTLDPAQPEHFDRLWAALIAAGRLPDRIVHLWTGPGSVEEDAVRDPDALERSQTLGFYSLLHLAQAMGRSESGVGTRITVVTSGLADVFDDAEVSHPENATLVGPVSVIPSEYPGVDCRLVDILEDAAAADDDSLAGFLLDETIMWRPAIFAAYRGGRRWERHYEHLRLETLDDHVTPPATSEGGVYLITGGLGGLGMLFARQLAESGPCVLALTGRSALPPRDEWEAWLAAHADNNPKVASTIRDLQALESGGAIVMPLAANVVDEQRMVEVFEEIRSLHGPVTGIIHAAGVPATGIIQLKTRELAASVMDPKVRGTLILDSLVGDDPLEFFVLFSSLNAVYVGMGGTDYCSANAFLDAFVRYRRSRGDPNVVSINWDAWQEVGMAVNTEVPADLQAAKEANLLNAIAPDEGLDAYRRILRSGMPQILVSTQDLNTLLASVVMSKVHGRSTREKAEEGFADAGAPGSEAPRHARPDLPTQYLEPRTETERQIAGVWQDLLGIDQIGVHDSFFELGGHSLLATRVLARIQQGTGLSLPLEAVFEGPTVAELAERIETIRWLATSEDEAEEEAGEREEIEL